MTVLRAINTAMEAVEHAGASPALTEATFALAWDALFFATRRR